MNAALDIIKMSFIARCTRPAHVYRHIAPALRGAFGYTLSQIFDKGIGAPGLYQTIFKNETEGVYSDEYVYGKPNPYVFEAPAQMSPEMVPGDVFGFNLALFGSACGYVPEVIFTVEQMLKGNIMNNERAFELLMISNFFSRKILYADGAVSAGIGLMSQPWKWTDQAVVYPPSYGVRIRFIEPVSVKENSMPAVSITFSLFVRSILNRLILLTSVYGGTCQLDREGFEVSAALIKTADNKLSDGSFVTFSRTQLRKKIYRGRIGAVTYEGDLSPFLPYIDIGSVLHIGGNTVMGMGQYLWERV